MGVSRRRYLDLPWGQLHYRFAEGPAGAPRVVLLHQSPLSSRNYDAALPELARWADSYALDTPGYGGSDPSPREWSVEEYADGFWAAIDTLCPGPVKLFGRATGAVFAVEMSLQRPDRVTGLVLHGVPVYTADEQRDRLAGFAPPYRLDAGGEHLVSIWQRITGEYPWAPPELVTHLVHDYLSCGPDFATAYRAIWRYDARRAMQQLATTPCLLSGERDRIGFMHERAREVLPDAPSRVLPDATDFVAETNPRLFAETVAALLGLTAKAGH